MKINRHNLTIVSHCAPEVLQDRITNGLEFSESGTSVTNGYYSVSVSALEVGKNEPLGCITPEDADQLLADMGKADDANLTLEDMHYIKGKRPRVDLIPRKPALFEIYLNAEYLLKIAQSARDFATPGEDPIIRIQFTGNDEPARLDARNTVTGQTWEALVMPRRPDTEAKRFAGASAASPFPPPPPVDPELIAALEVEDEFEKAVRLAASL